MSIERCVCFDVTFRTMKAYAEEHECDFEGLREHFGCGRGCALCVPYVKAMLKTGRTEFSPDTPPTECD